MEDYQVIALMAELLRYVDGKLDPVGCLNLAHQFLDMAKRAFPTHGESIDKGPMKPPF